MPKTQRTRHVPGKAHYATDQDDRLSAEEMRAAFADMVRLLSPAARGKHARAIQSIWLAIGMEREMLREQERPPLSKGGLVFSDEPIAVQFIGYPPVKKKA